MKGLAGTALVVILFTFCGSICALSLGVRGGLSFAKILKKVMMKPLVSIIVLNPEYKSG